MKGVISKFLLVLGLLPFFLLATSEDWIPPTVKDVDFFVISINGNVVKFSSIDAAVDGWFSQTPRQECSRDSPVLVLPPDRWSILVGFIAVGADPEFCALKSSIGLFVDRVSELDPVCDDPNYQMGIDSDNLDGIDQCHATICPSNDLFWSNGNGVSTPSGSICIQNPISGVDCKYDAIENTDGSRSNFTFKQAGEGCSCNSELVPCNDLGDGEVTNFPQGQDGCVSMADSVFCSADPDVECNNGVCNPGCGYVGTEFVCVESQIDPVDSEACQAGDLRPICAGVDPGDCPPGSLNCANENTPPDPPEAPCVTGDSRPECAGVPVGDSPPSGEGGATSDDISQLSGLLSQGNRNTKAIKDNTKKISDTLSELNTFESFDPTDSSGLQDAKSVADQSTSFDDINPSESQFKSDFNAQEGFYNTQIQGLVPTVGSCQNLVMALPRGNVVIDACQYLIHAKIVIEWAMILAFLMYIRSTFSRLKPN